MSGIDERIVEMTFKGAAFVSGISAAVAALTKLKSGLSGLKGSNSDLDNLDSSAKKFSLGNISSGLDTIASKFKTMSVIGISALATLTSRAVNAGINIVKALTIDPIRAGLESYETKINAIQTIMANTAASGTTLKQVTAALAQLNQYANLTVYNFGEMAKNIGTFTAAGVGLKTAVSSIKGIANLAALSGSSAQQATSAMYQLSQAIAAGRVKLQDWNSVVNAGIGGKVFQNALIQTARATGVNIDAIIKKAGSFRQSLQSGWLSSKILTQTLDTFTGDLSAKQLKAMGYTNAETQAILKQGKIAVQSATQVRTISALMQDLKEEVATAWAAIFQALIGNSKQATDTLSALHNAAENFLTKPIYDLAKIIQSFTDLGGRDLVIQAITEALKDLGAILHTVGVAFQEVFPSNGAGATLGLIKMAIAFQNFIEKLTPSKQTLQELTTIFAGIFSVIKIVIDIVSGLIGALTHAGSSASTAGKGFLGIIAGIAQFIINVRKAIESGTALASFFHLLGTVLSIPAKIISALISSLGGVSGAVGQATGGLTGFVQKVGDLFKNVADLIGKGITSGNFSAVSALLNHLLVGSILLTIKNFFKGFGAASGGGAGIFAGIKESLEGLTNTLKVMQDKLKSDILEKIAIAIGLLAASLLLLSFIPVQGLTKAITAITSMFILLSGALNVMVKIAGTTGIVKMVAIGVALNLLATALVILSGAVAILAQFSWSQLERGLAAIAILLVELVGATLLMSKNTVGLLGSAYSIETLAVALNILALAVTKLSKISLGGLVKGIGAIAALLLIVGVFNKASSKGLISSSLSMVILAAALNIIAKAVETLGRLSTDTLAKGLVSIAAALLIIGLAMNLMPPTMVATAVSLLLVATALVILAKALNSLGGMSWAQIGKALVVLAGALVIIAAAMILMTEALLGAAALIVVAGALAILTPVLIALSSIPWEGIAKGLVALTGVFLIIAAAGILLTPLVPTLLGLGLAITLLGTGILAAGVGIGLFAVGLTALAVAVTSSGAAILSFVTSILGLIPAALTQLGKGISAFAVVIGKSAPALTSAFAAMLTAIFNGIIKVTPLAAKAFGTVMVAMLGAINKYSPQIITTFANLIVRVLNNLARYYPRFVSAGISLLVNLLNGIARQVPRVANSAVNVVVAFINAVGASELRIVRAGINMVINLINGIANEIRASSPRINAAARNLGSAIIEGMVAGIFGGIGAVTSAAASLARSALDEAKHVLKIGSPSKEFIDLFEWTGKGAAIGILNSTDQVTSSAKTMGTAVLSTLSDTLAGISSTLGDNIDLQPKITPVVDLTQAKKGFNDLSSLSKSQLLASASTASAASISASNASAAQAAGLLTGTTKSLTFNQYNTSPTALSTIDIYRRTKNQISMAKGALTGNANVG